MVLDEKEPCYHHIVLLVVQMGGVPSAYRKKGEGRNLSQCIITNRSYLVSQSAADSSDVK